MTAHCRDQRFRMLHHIGLIALGVAACGPAAAPPPVTAHLPDPAARSTGDESPTALGALTEHAWIGTSDGDRIALRLSASGDSIKGLLSRVGEHPNDRDVHGSFDRLHRRLTLDVSACIDGYSRAEQKRGAQGSIERVALGCVARGGAHSGASVLILELAERQSLEGVWRSPNGSEQRVRFEPAREIGLPIAIVHRRERVWAPQPYPKAATDPIPNLFGETAGCRVRDEWLELVGGVASKIERRINVDLAAQHPVLSEYDERRLDRCWKGDRLDVRETVRVLALAPDWLTTLTTDSRHDEQAVMGMLSSRTQLRSFDLSSGRSLDRAALELSNTAALRAVRAVMHACLDATVSVGPARDVLERKLDLENPELAVGASPEGLVFAVTGIPGGADELGERVIVLRYGALMAAGYAPKSPALARLARDAGSAAGDFCTLGSSLD